MNQEELDIAQPRVAKAIQFSRTGGPRIQLLKSTYGWNYTTYLSRAFNVIYEKDIEMFRGKIKNGDQLQEIPEKKAKELLETVREKAKKPVEEKPKAEEPEKSKKKGGKK